jgi:hypothetical protein
VPLCLLPPHPSRTRSVAEPPRPLIVAILLSLAFQVVSGSLAGFSGPEDFERDQPGKAAED